MFCSACKEDKYDWKPNEEGIYISQSSLKNVDAVAELTGRIGIFDQAKVVFELGSGTGTHVMRFAKLHPNVKFIASELRSLGEETVRKRLEKERFDNVSLEKAICLTKNLEEEFCYEHLDADTLVAINVFHTCPPVCMENFGKLAKKMGVKRVFVYGYTCCCFLFFCFPFFL